VYLVIVDAKQNLTMTSTSKQNGVAKKENQTILELVWKKIYDSGLHLRIWVDSFMFVDFND
jgi:hypothetical protein